MVSAVQPLAALAGWLLAHLPLLLLLLLGLLAAAAALYARLSGRAAADRVAFELRPSPAFTADAEQLLRYACQLARAAGSAPWWAPGAATAVRIRLIADGTTPLAFRIEGPATARHLLASCPYAGVQVREVPVLRRAPAKHVARAEFVLAGPPGAGLRTVPLDPDPLQPLADAVAEVRAECGDRVEVCLDLAPVPAWRLRLRRAQLLRTARERARKQARRQAWQSWWDTVDAEHSLRYQLIEALEGLGGQRHRGASPRRWALLARPRPLDAEAVLGKLATDPSLLRIQVLVRTESQRAGRPAQRMSQIQTAFDIYTAGARWRQAGWRLGPWWWGADRWPHRDRFDARWYSGQLATARDSWVGVAEITGWLKPPTRTCRLPVPERDLPTYTLGDVDRIPVGYYRGPDGAERLLGAPLADVLFALMVGKAGGGKTEMALGQAIALAHGGHGLLFLDPHGDTWARALPYLAHCQVMARTWHIDLTGPPIGTWNPLDMRRQPAAHEVVNAVVDAFSAVLGWSELTAPRALTILTKATEALVGLNAHLCANRRPQLQATLFCLRPLLTDPPWREAVLGVLAPPVAAWWRTTFGHYPAEAIPTVTNAIDRLAADPTLRAFLGAPMGSYDIRAAMDAGRLVWICPAGTGPTDRLVAALLIQDVFRAGLSRRALPIAERRPFYVFIDELTAVDGAASGGVAAIAEQLRKFGVRLVAMTQMAQRLTDATRQAMIQNSSILATTTGSTEAIRAITGEWHGAISPEEAALLPRFEHYLSLTVEGRRIGPLRIRGAEVADLFGPWHRPGQDAAFAQAVDAAMGRRPVAEILDEIADLEERIHAVLTYPHRPDPSGRPTPDELSARRRRREHPTRYL